MFRCSGSSAEYTGMAFRSIDGDIVKFRNKNCQAQAIAFPFYREEYVN